MKRYRQYRTTMEEHEDGPYYKVAEVDALLKEVNAVVKEVKNLALKGVENNNDMRALVDSIEGSLNKYKAALQWISENPWAHPGNMVAVAREALK